MRALVTPPATAGRRALRLSEPIALLAMLAAAGGILLPGTYAAEAPSWAAQAVGQDVVNLLLVGPAMLVLGVRARRGSAFAYPIWLGLVAYDLYSYLLYAGYTHFSAWFPLYVALLGLSGWALVLGMAGLQPLTGPMQAPATARWRAGTWLALFGGGYAVLEFAVIGGAIARGVAPASAVEAGLPTDPVLMLDLAFVLPGMALCGLLTRRGNALAATLAVGALSFATAMGTAVFAMLLMVGWRVAPAPPPVLVGFALFTTMHALALRGLVRPRPNRRG